MKKLRPMYGNNWKNIETIRACKFRVWDFCLFVNFVYVNVVIGIVLGIQNNRNKIYIYISTGYRIYIYIHIHIHNTKANKKLCYAINILF